MLFQKVQNSIQAAIDKSEKWSEKSSRPTSSSSEDEDEAEENKHGNESQKNPKRKKKPKKLKKNLMTNPGKTPAIISSSTSTLAIPVPVREVSLQVQGLNGNGKTAHFPSARELPHVEPYHIVDDDDDEIAYSGTKLPKINIMSEK